MQIYRISGGFKSLSQSIPDAQQSCRLYRHSINSKSHYEAEDFRNRDRHQRRLGRYCIPALSSPHDLVLFEENNTRECNPFDGSAVPSLCESLKSVCHSRKHENAYIGEHMKRIEILRDQGQRGKIQSVWKIK